MIVLTVESFNGSPAEPLSASFDELGGTIGRQANNQLVLRDPEQTVSRIHASVVFRNGTFSILDQGANALLINGLALGAGREASLKNGDRLEIGGFLLRVSFGQAPKAPDKFETNFLDLFDEGPTGAPAVRSAASPARSPGPPPAPSTTPSPWPATPSPAAPSGSSILDDWDDFDDLHPDRVASAPAEAHRTSELLPHEASLDELFGLSGASPDPVASPKGPSAAAMRDDIPEIHTPFPQPSSRTGARQVVSWEQSDRQNTRIAPASSTGNPSIEPSETIVGPKRSTADSATVMPAGKAPVAGALPPSPRVDAPAASSPTASPGSVRPARTAGTDPIAALLEGLGVKGIDASKLDPGQARVLGAVLRQSMQGTVQLLQGRAAFKRVLRSEVTTIQARENNPLKFSPDAETVLRTMLHEPTHGFLAPEAAVRDAFDDLQAHQLALMVGMQAALQGLLERFNPESLERKIAPPTGLASLLPSGRKAQLWERFGSLYSQLAREAEDGFHELFSSEFVKAYEYEITQLRQRK